MTNGFAFNHTKSANLLCKARVLPPLNLIKQEVDYEVNSLAMIKHMPAYLSQLGFSKSRMFQQAELGKELVMDMLMEAPDTSFAFTNASSLINPL